MTEQNSLLEKFLSSVKLPTSPEVVTQLVRTLSDEDYHLGQVAALIAKDTGITATVLKHANSARYGLATKVGSVDDAIRLLGFNAVRSIALGAGVEAAFPVTGGLDKLEFWKSSETTADLAHKLAAKAGVDKSLAWLVGFMVRVGELLIAQHDAEAIGKIEMLPRPPGSRWSREASMLGLTEGQVMAELARSWNFPDAVVTALNAIAAPISDEWPFSKLAGIGHVAGVLSDAIMAGMCAEEDLSAILPGDVVAELGITREVAISVLDSAGAAAA